VGSPQVALPCPGRAEPDRRYEPAVRLPQGSMVCSAGSERCGCLGWRLPLRYADASACAGTHRMSWTVLLGLVAATCGTVAFIPQVVQAWRTRSTKDVSLGMFLLLVTGLCLWLVYGFLTGDLPIIGANASTLVLAGTILVLKLHHG